MDKSVTISEEIAWLNGIGGAGANLFLGDATGNIWQPISGGAGAAGGFFAWYRILQTS